MKCASKKSDHLEHLEGYGGTWENSHGRKDRAKLQGVFGKLVEKKFILI